MTIAKTGPAGYEHQYRVSVLVGLVFAGHLPELFIESLGEEDATLRRLYGGRESTLEIQIKSSKRAVDLKEVAEMLATFPKGSSADCLLERLLRDPSRMVFLIFGGRCCDPLSGLLVPLRALPSEPHTHRPLGQTQATRLRDAIGEVYRGGSRTPLRKARDAKCAELAKDTTVTTLRAVAHRVVLVEQTGTEQVLEEIRRVLVHQHRVPGAVAHTLADAPLRCVVEQARDDEADLMPSLLEEIGRHQSEAIGPQRPYIVHAYEDELHSRLERDHALLLTGLPLSGKTQLSCSLAERAQRRGFHTVKKQRVDEAYRFLLDPAGGESRLVLLEDPFGKVTTSRDGQDDWARLADLLRELKPHRHLIATSRNDILAELRASTDASTWTSEGISWVDMTTKARPSLVEEAWKAWATAQKRDPAEIAALGQRLGSDALASLQPGHASFLARDHEHDYGQLSDPQILVLARKDATDLSRELCSSPGGERVLRGLGSSATTLDGPDETTLAFILGNESSSWPGLRSKEKFGEIASLPRIEGNVGFRAEWVAVLEAFERRGVIEWSEDRCRFTHPLWEEAGIQALLGTGHFAAKEIRRIVENTLLCCDATSSRNAVAALTRMSLGSYVGRALSPALVELMSKATESIFPRVADLAVAFLLENLDGLQPETRAEVIRSAENGLYSPRLLSWNNGVAWFSKRTYSYELAQKMREDNRRRRRVDALCRNPKVDEFSADQLLEIYELQQSYNANNVAHLERGLGVEEAIVRAEACHAIALHHWQSRSGLVRRGLSDPHPRVVVRTMMGLAVVWARVDSRQRAQWQQILVHRLRRAGFGFVALQRLLVFRQWAGRNPGWYEGQTASWDLWCACMIAALSTDPGYFGLDEPKLYDLIEQAMNEVPMDTAVELCGAWLDWTERRLSYDIPSDYGGSMAQSVLRATGKTAIARGAIVSRMTQQDDTAFQALLLRDLCRNCDLLSSQECDEILACLRSDRGDVRWLKAIVLVDGEAPSEFLGELTGCDDPLSLSPQAIVRRFPKQLLGDALHVFCGHPQPLWYIGTHHVNDELWRPVLLYIASMPTHGLFDLAIRELLCWGEGKPDAVSVWEVLCRTTDKATMQTLFEALLKQTIVNSIAPLASHWWLVVRSPHAPPLRANWAKMVADEIEAIGCSKNTGIVLSQLPEAFEHLPGEKFLYELSQFVAESERLGMKDDPKVQESIAAHARVLLKKDPPREHEMLDVLITLVEKGGGSSSPGDDPIADPVLDAARTRRRNAIDKGAARRRALSVDGPPPPEWHYSYLENG